MMDRLAVETLENVLSFVNRKDLISFACAARCFTTLALSLLYKDLVYCYWGGNIRRSSVFLRQLRQHPAQAAYIRSFAYYQDGDHSFLPHLLALLVMEGTALRRLKIVLFSPLAPLTLSTRQASSRTTGSMGGLHHLVRLECTISTQSATTLMEIYNCAVALEEFSIKSVIWQPLEIAESIEIRQSALKAISLENVALNTINRLLFSCSSSIASIRIHNSPTQLSMILNPLPNLRRVYITASGGQYLPAILQSSTYITHLTLAADVRSIKILKSASKAIENVTHLQLLDDSSTTPGRCVFEIQQLLRRHFFGCLEYFEVHSFANLLAFLPSLPRTLRHVVITENSMVTAVEDIVRLSTVHSRLHVWLEHTLCLDFRVNNGFCQLGDVAGQLSAVKVIKGVKIRIVVRKTVFWSSI